MTFSGYAATIAAVIVLLAVRLPATFAPIDVVVAGLAAAAGAGLAAGFAVPFLWRQSCAAVTAVLRDLRQIWRNSRPPS